MKTVEDAYKSGVCNDWCEASDINDQVVLFCISESIDEDDHFELGKFYTGIIEFSRDYFYPACTRQEFEDYAKKMELDKLNKEAVKEVAIKQLKQAVAKKPIGNCKFVEPAYTHELMVRGGVNVKEQYEPVLKVFSGDKFSVYKNENGKEYVRKNSKVKLRKIDTRTDEEKLIDDVAETIRSEKEVHMLDKVKAKLLIDKFEIKLK